MAVFNTSSGLARSIQSIDTTGQCIAEVIQFTTGISQKSMIFTIDVHGNEIPVETFRNKFETIWEKTNSELSEAWSKLAQM
jgi:hypothetical protein